jgi:sugar transferase (PEP-CTERM system associated)
MVSFASGLALPFFLLAIFPSYLKRLPKSGGWMSRIKVVLGFVILAASLKYASSIDQVMQWGFITRERFLAAWVVLFAMAGLYLLGFLRLEGVKPEQNVGVSRLLIGMAFAACFVYLNRAVADKTSRFSLLHHKVLVLGTKELAVNVAREFSRRRDLPVQFMGFVQSDHQETAAVYGYPVLGCVADLETIVETQQISRIVVALEERRGALPVRELVRLRVKGIRIEDAHSAMAALSGRIWLQTVQPSWFVFTEDGFRRSRMALITKRLIDLYCGTLGLVLGLPFMLLAAIAIKLESKGPVIYRQTRVGLRGNTFELFKFRSMRTDAEENGARWAAKDDPRVTRAGKYLRKYRLDELPQFINIIRGEMSFVGPRPERHVFVEKLRHLISYYDERHSVRPGLTGWAQVQYSYGASVEDAARKMEYDLFYLKNMSVFFDILIIFKTIGIVLTGHGGR